MNLKERELQYPLGDAVPALGSTMDVAPGVRWLRMGLPFALDHINLWLLRDQQDGIEGWTIVDCGISNDATRDWQARLDIEWLDAGGTAIDGYNDRESLDSESRHDEQTVTLSTLRYGLERAKTLKIRIEFEPD